MTAVRTVLDENAPHSQGPEGTIIMKTSTGLQIDFIIAETSRPSKVVIRFGVNLGDAQPAIGYVLNVTDGPEILDLEENLARHMTLATMAVINQCVRTTQIMSQTMGQVTRRQDRIAAEVAAFRAELDSNSGASNARDSL